MKHTPGPWKAKFQGGKHGRVYVANMNGQNVVDAGAVSVVDATLIAAAPELLTALIKCADQLEIIKGMVHDERAALIDARAAIAKATGETK
jgi:hypothetical protein